jgi:hypothetical protein
MYVESHKLHVPSNVTKPLSISEPITNCKFDARFVEICDSQKDNLADMVLLAHFWNVSALLDLLI